MTPVNPAGNGTRSILTSDGHSELFLANGMHVIMDFACKCGLFIGGRGGGWGGGAATISNSGANMSKGTFQYTD